MRKISHGLYKHRSSSGYQAVAPSPEAKQRLKAEMANLAASNSPLAANLAVAQGPKRLGFNDGVIYPPAQFPLGTPQQLIAPVERHCVGRFA